MATPDDINSTLQGIARQMGAWVAAFNGRIVSGSFTLAGGTTTVVSQASVTANSIIVFSPTNATAALTQRSGGLYLSARTAASTFSISTQSGTTIGSETFNYLLFNPS
jgi:hypothetical protein